MAKSCLCERLLGDEYVRLRLESVSLAGRWVWMMVIRAIATSDEPGVLQLGYGVGLVSWVSRIARASETEVETQLETLIAHGLLVRAGDTVALPASLAAQSRRAATARINGLKGGRPRKDAAPRAQTALALPIAGGLAEKPTETERGAPSTSSTKIDSSTTGDVDGWVSLASEACDAAGLDPNSGMHTFGIVKSWMQLGATREVILSTIDKLVASKASPGRITTLRYFDQAIRREAASKPAAPKLTIAQELERDAYREALAHWQSNGYRGQQPALPDFLREVA